MAGGIQVLRVEKRSRVNGAVAAHVLGEHVHEVHEVPPDQELDIRILVDDRDRVAAYLAGLRVHGNASPGVEFVIAGCRSEWTREEQDAYFVRSFQWIRDKAGPHTMISAAAIHRHETSPHMQVLMAAVGMTDEMIQASKTTTKDGKTRYRYKPSGRKVRRVGWKAIRDGFCYGKGRASDRMSRMQDNFHTEVAAGFGLERGKIGSQAVHEEIDRAKAARDRTEKAELKEAAANERAEQAKTSADELEEKQRLDEALEAGATGRLGRQAKRGRELHEKRDAAFTAKAEADRARQAAEQERDRAIQEAGEFQAGIREELDLARERDRERRTLKEELDASAHEIEKVLGDSEARGLVQSQLRSARRAGVQQGKQLGWAEIWLKLREFAQEVPESWEMLHRARAWVAERLPDIAPRKDTALEKGKGSAADQGPGY